jgi:GH25 family lysozyme M1 (1,4-beta-N-acetylmuramidase)
MTIHFPDVSPFQGGIGLSGAPAVAMKTTEGTGWQAGKWFTDAAARAKAAGALGIAYHFLHAGNPAGQAAWCNARDGGLPLMLDWEPTGSSRPGMGDATGFIDAYRKAGGVCNLLYFPHWYWQQIGSPSLSPMISRHMALWSSAYSGYSDTGQGWAPYGGMTPAVWQWTDAHAFNGQRVDFSAFKGTIAQFRALAGGAAPAAPADVKPGTKAPPFPYGAGHYLGQPSSSGYCHSGYYGGADNANVHTWQVQMVRRGWKLAQDGRFGPDCDAKARAFQAEKGLGVDGKVGAQTWAATWTAPVTR